MLSCLMCADLVAVSGQLGPGWVSACWSALRREEEGRGEFWREESALSRGRRRRMSPGCTGQGFLSSQSVTDFVWCVSAGGQNGPCPKQDHQQGAALGWEGALPC